MDRRRRLPSLTHSNATRTFPGAFVTVTTMTTQPDHQPMEISDAVRAAWATHPDHRLAVLEAFAGAINTEVTLCIPGATIEGTTMAYNEFADIERSKLHGRLDEAEIEPGDGLPDDFAEVISSQLFPHHVAPQNEAEAVNEMPPTAIHLKNAKMVGNGYTPIAPLEFERIRIPIAQITSWSIGRSS